MAAFSEAILPRSQWGLTPELRTPGVKSWKSRCDRLSDALAFLISTLLRYYTTQSSRVPSILDFVANPQDGYGQPSAQLLGWHASNLIASLIEDNLHKEKAMQRWKA
jgi:hypothetical protein